MSTEANADMDSVIYVLEVDNGDHDMFFAGAFTTLEAAIEAIEHIDTFAELDRDNTHVFQWQLNRPVSQRERLEQPDMRARPNS